MTTRDDDLLFESWSSINKVFILENCEMFHLMNKLLYAAFSNVNYPQINNGIRAERNYIRCKNLGKNLDQNIFQI